MRKLELGGDEDSDSEGAVGGYTPAVKMLAGAEKLGAKLCHLRKSLMF